MSVAELSVAGWLASVAAIADEADRDQPNMLLHFHDPMAAPTCRLVARCRPDQEARLDAAS